MASAPAVVVACATCRGGPIKCWRCAPSAASGTLSGSDSSEGGRRDASGARPRRQARAAATSSEGSADVRPQPRVRGARADRRGACRTGRSSTESDDGATRKRGRRRDGDGDRCGSSGSPADRREIDRMLARYVPDDEARAGALAVMTASAQEAREWYNARAADTNGRSASIAASGSPSFSSSSSSSSSSRSSLSSLSWTHADPLADVRGAINFCKSVLIGRYVQPRCAVMDLGCGRGQDVAKLAYARPRHVLFVDASESALAEAERRWRRARFAFPAAFVQDDFCAPDGLLAGRRVVVYRDDPQRAPGQRHHAVPDAAEFTASNGIDLVDAISCQFAIQHAFETRATALAFVSNVRRALRPGGVFVGIVADGVRLWELARQRVEPPHDGSPTPDREGSVDRSGAGDGVDHSADSKVAGELCPRRVTLVAPAMPTQAACSHTPCALGVVAHGPPCPQHTVVFDEFSAMCIDAGLVLMMSCDLATFFDVESINPRNASMLDRMRAPLRLDDSDDREHMGLYRAFAFARRTDREATRLLTPAAAAAATTTTTIQPDGGHRGASRSRPSGRALSFVWSSGVAR
ncbi:mRNA cap guanine-N7 methyltransferase [Pandoravirus salinus]|uniref:mRNA (guanine-N(7))-methyltransferase n=1 Tax=Pandoravirus salinus TaxID=1349410 RepID=A0A291ATM0_9VIRU|nr:Methyltransferase [Pandoravirus salinus]ATE82146.1 mRNA cap guanine-N7 methyltransferase [Pandoravirus salinus]